MTPAAETATREKLELMAEHAGIWTALLEGHRALAADRCEALAARFRDGGGRVDQVEVPTLLASLGLEREPLVFLSQASTEADQWRLWQWFESRPELQAAAYALSRLGIRVTS